MTISINVDELAYDKELVAMAIIQEATKNLSPTERLRVFQWAVSFSLSNDVAYAEIVFKEK